MYAILTYEMPSMISNNRKWEGEVKGESELDRYNDAKKRLA